MCLPDHWCALRVATVSNIANLQCSIQDQLLNNHSYRYQTSAEHSTCQAQGAHLVPGPPMGSLHWWMMGSGEAAWRLASMPSSAALNSSYLQRSCMQFAAADAWQPQQCCRHLDLVSLHAAYLCAAPADVRKTSKERQIKRAGTPACLARWGPQWRTTACSPARAGRRRAPPPPSRRWRPATRRRPSAG